MNQTPNKVAQLSAGPIHYYEAGQGEPIVFVHGFAVDGSLWAPVAADLAADYRVIVPTWPLGSHTEPMKPDADLRPPAIAALISEFLAELDLDGATIVGNDSGGAISQILVTERPERIGRLILTNCDAFENFPPGRFKVLLGAMGVPGFPWILAQSMRPEFMRRSPLAFGALNKVRVPSETLESWVRPLISNAGVRRDASKFATGCDPKLTMAAAEKLPGLKIPALMAWGEDDRFFKISDAHKLAELIPDARVVPIADAVTFVSLDQPQRLAEAMREFLAG